MSSCIAADASLSPAKPAWRAVYALALGVFGLIVAEFLPASLLTPMASSLGVSEGMAGQAVTATALVALVTGLLIATATRNIDRRWVLMFFSVLQIVSSLMVAFADSLAFLLLGRLLLGIAIGGFWAMSTATAMRLVPAAHVPKALAIIFSAVSVATVVAAPLGSYLGELIGWRNVFILCAIPSLLALLWQLWVLPSMRPESVGTFSTLFRVLRRPGMLGGMLATILIFSGHFAFFTYLRPFLETVAQASVEGVSLILLGFGVANFIGTSVASYLLSRSLRLTLALVPLMMSVLALLMVTFGHLTVLAGLLVALWGFAFGLVPVAWSTWLATTVPDEAESAGGLLVASIQLAISAGAAGGGAVFDLHGASGVFTGSGLLLLSAMVIVFAAVRVKPVARADQPVTGRYPARSITKLADRLREQHSAICCSAACFSASDCTVSRWSTVPSRTGVRQAPQIPISQESGTATPCSCSTWAMVLSPGTGQRSPVEARVMVKVPSAADAAVGAGGWNASLCNCASSHPTARAVSRTRAINPGGPQK